MFSSEASWGQALAKTDRGESYQGVPASMRIVLGNGPTGSQPTESTDQLGPYRMFFRAHDRTDYRNTIGTEQHRVTGRPDGDIGNRMEDRVPT